jgi:hypothetical protein
MAKSRLDWSVLRGSLGIFGICALVSAVMLGASYHFLEEMDTEYRNHHARFRDASRKYLAVDEEERVIQSHLPQFIALHEQGILGPERRLDWLETLSAAGNDIDLPQMTYRINAQTQFDTDLAVNLGAFNIYTSDMELSLGLLHEGDFARLIDLLDRNTAGLYSVRWCEMSRSFDEFTLETKRANIQAECILSWFTVDLRGERKLAL